MKLMKDIIRHALGVIFLFFFLVFLFVSAVQFKVLTPKFWMASLSSSGVYQELVTNVGSLQQQVDSSMGKGVLQIEGVITEERLQSVIDENISRLLGYIKGKSNELLLFLPLRTWGLPSSILNQSQFKNLSENTKLVDALAVLGMKPEIATQLEPGLATVQRYVRFLPLVWLVLLVVVAGFGFLYWSLGAGWARLSHIGFLFLVAGLIAVVMGFAGTTLAAVVMRGNAKMPIWVSELGTALITKFFSLGQIIGFIVAAAGAILLIIAKRLVDQEKHKGKAVVQSMKSRIVKLVAGVTLGSLFLLLAFGGLIGSIASKLNLTTQLSSSSADKQASTASLPFTMQAPEGWTTETPDKSKGIFIHYESPVLDKEPTGAGSVTTNAIILVRVTDKYTNLSDFVEKYKATSVNTRGYQSIDTSPQTVGGQESYRMEFTFVTTVQKHDVVVHELDYLFFKGGASFLAKGFASNSSWSKHTGEIQGSLNTFTFK